MTGSSCIVFLNLAVVISSDRYLQYQRPMFRQIDRWPVYIANATDLNDPDLNKSCKRKGNYASDFHNFVNIDKRMKNISIDQ